MTAEILARDGRVFDVSMHAPVTALFITPIVYIVIVIATRDAYACLRKHTYIGIQVDVQTFQTVGDRICDYSVTLQYCD